MHVAAWLSLVEFESHALLNACDHDPYQSLLKVGLNTSVIL